MESLKIRSLIALAAIVAVAACNEPDRSVSTPTTGRALDANGRVQVHDRQGWSPVLFREIVQGKNAGDGECQYPGMAAAVAKHPNLVNPFGEYDPNTCEGVLYFGDWANDIVPACGPLLAPLLARGPARGAVPTQIGHQLLREPSSRGSIARG